MEHGPYIAERTQNAAYVVRCLWSIVNTVCPVEDVSSICEIKDDIFNRLSFGGAPMGIAELRAKQAWRTLTALLLSLIVKSGKPKHA
jgi:hypothetical protein